MSDSNLPAREEQDRAEGLDSQKLTGDEKRLRCSGELSADEILYAAKHVNKLLATYTSNDHTAFKISHIAEALRRV